MNKRLLSLLLVLPMIGSYVQAVSVTNPYKFDVKYKTSSQERELKDWKKNQSKEFPKGTVIYLHEQMGEYLGSIKA